MITSAPFQFLCSCFARYLPLNTLEKEELGSRLLEISIKRNTYILRENEICRHFTFVSSGCLRLFQTDDKGVAHNIQFALAGEWMMEYDSFYSEKSGRAFIQAVEPAVLLQIKKQDLLYLFRSHPKFDRNFRVINENRCIALEKRIFQSISSTAEERYLSFIADFPDLRQRLPDTQIASYIGITPAFLSKIRKKLSKSGG